MALTVLCAAGAPVRDAATQFDVPQRPAEVDNMKAQISNAEWDLAKTTIRSDGGHVASMFTVWA